MIESPETCNGQYGRQARKKTIRNQYALRLMKPLKIVMSTILMSNQNDQLWI